MLTYLAATAIENDLLFEIHFDPVCIFLIFAVGCGKKPVKLDNATEKVVQNNSHGLWNPRSKNEIAVDRMMKGNISMAQQASESRARDGLSRQRAQTKSMIKDFIHEGKPVVRPLPKKRLRLFQA